MRMTHYILGATVSGGLAACAMPQVEPMDIPVDVDAYLPTDIDKSEVNKDPDGCYFYTYAADLFVVRDEKGNPVCAP